MPAMLKRISDGIPATKLIGVSGPDSISVGAGGDSQTRSISAHSAGAVIPEDDEANFTPDEKCDQSNQG